MSDNRHDHDHRLHQRITAKLEAGAYRSADAEAATPARYGSMKWRLRDEMGALFDAAHAAAPGPGTFTLFTSEHSCGFKAALVLVCEEAGDCDRPEPPVD
jgi:hypothetical protein